MENVVKNVVILYPLFLLYYFSFGYGFSRFVSKFPDKKIQKVLPSNNIKVDIRNSVISLFLSSVFLSLGIHFKSIGIANENLFTSYSVVNFILGVAIGLFLLDTVIYWTHRCYHINQKIFKALHRPHHKNNNVPTVWCTYNENPLGFTIAQCFFAYIVFVIPISIPTLIFLNVYVMSLDIMGHSGYDVFPRVPIMVTISDHDLHHKSYNCNYAPYLMFWDKLLKTYKE